MIGQLIARLEATLENVNLRQIEAFLAVAEELHFGRAAERLSVSAPWLSHTVRDLSERCGSNYSFAQPAVSRSPRRAACSPVWRAKSSLSSRRP